MSVAKPGPTSGRPQPSSAPAGVPKARKPSLVSGLRRAVLKVILPFREHLPDNAVTPQEAVASFLGTMASTAARTCGLWRQQLEIALADCLSADARKEFFDRYPVEDCYFAGVAALEAAKIRELYPPFEADGLLAEIGDQIDRAAGRLDRVMSEMVFDIIGRIEMSRGPTQQKMPYDKVVTAILRHLDIHRNELTAHLMSDKAFRHALGEPLAVGIQNWWQSFQSRFVLHIPPQPEPEEPEDDYMPPPQAAPPRRRRLKRAASLI